MELTYLLRN